MNIKFEIINGQLCRMVEPEPLTDNTKYPCVMTRKYRSPSAMDYLNEYMVIGYPVADGSHYWALYQIRSGNKVAKEGCGERYANSFYENRLFYLNDSGCLVTKNGIGLIDPCSEEEFLSLDETGWQLYEPQPIDSGRWACYECGVKDSRKEHFPGCSRDKKPKSAYKVGDWVQCGTMQAEIRELREILNGRQIYHMKEADGTEYDADSSAFVRKLSSSEVRVKITLEGTVQAFGEKTKGFWLICETNPYAVAFADIDPATAKLVKELLDKQKGDDK